MSGRAASLSSGRRWGGPPWLPLAAGAAGLATLAVAAWLTLGRPPSNPSPPAPPPAGQFHPTQAQWLALSFGAVEAGPLAETVETDGKVAAADPLTTQVFAPASGRIQRVMAHLGQTVRAGQPLAELEGVESAQAAGDLASAVVQARSARANEARLAALYKEEGASLKDWQQSQNDLAAAEDALQNARARLLGMGLSPAQVHLLETRRPGPPPPFTLAAPVAGTIIQQSASAGLAIAPLTAGGATALFTLSDLSRVWIVGALREEDGPKAYVGAPIEARSPALPGRVIRGRLDYVAPVLDPATRRILVHATVPNPGGLLRPEMFLDVRLITGATARGLTAPAEAVIYEGERAHVWVADPRSMSLALREVTLGRTQGGRVEVRSGLRAGEQVVTRGALFVDQAAKGD